MSEKSPLNIVQKHFLNLATSLVCKYFCNPLKSKISRFPNVTYLEKRFLNSGGYIGNVEDIYAILHHIVNVMEISPTEDDQKDFQEIFLGTSHFSVLPIYY